MANRFVTFEGGEGVGKSTQVPLLAKRLGATGATVTTTREPGGSPSAEVIRHILLSGGARPMGADVEALLFAAARADHLEHTIRPALERGEWVLCDRFIDSTRVYQALDGVSEVFLGELERVSTDGLLPDLTIILDLPASRGLKRTSGRGAAGGQNLDPFEAEPMDMHRKRRNAFLDIARGEPRRCKVVPCGGSVEDVSQRIWDLVRDHFDLTMMDDGQRDATPLERSET